MILGHYGFAFGAGRWTGEVSLGILVLAAQWVDLLWPILVLAGIEQVAIQPGITAFSPLEFTHYPWSHSLLMGLVWGVILGGGYYAWRQRVRDALIVGALVPSHWVLDLVVHRPDLPLWPGGPTVGLGLWDSVAATLVIEFLLLALGVGLYLTATHPRDRIGSWGTYALVGLLVIVYLGASFGPTPTDATAVATGALALWLVVPLAHWTDAHRTRLGTAS